MVSDRPFWAIHEELPTSETLSRISFCARSKALRKRPSFAERRNRLARTHSRTRLSPRKRFVSAIMGSMRRAGVFVRAGRANCKSLA
jgi:hypothetical protein